MRSSQYKTTVPVEISVGVWSTELSVEVRFTYYPETPPTQPSYACGGEPGESEGVGDVEVICARNDKGETFHLPPWLREWISDNLDQDTLCEHAAGEREYEHDRAMEDRADRMREEGF